MVEFVLRSVFWGVGFCVEDYMKKNKIVKLSLTTKMDG